VALAITMILRSPAAMAASESELVVSDARSLSLARSLEWFRLLHYRPAAFGGVISEVDGPEFFLAPTGNEEPEAELEATIRAFYAPVSPGAEDAHAICRFPARFMWLSERLRLADRLHAPDCPALARYDLSSVESVSVVYAANYIDNPSSAFGHTFFHLKRRSIPEAPFAADQGIDYAAKPDTSNPLLYVFKGLTGMFAGYFTVHSFNSKLWEYGNYEARDLWEYQLTLTRREVRLLTLHLWELFAARIDFYYLTRNCAFEILAAIEAAAVRLDLVSKLRAPVLPADTIKVLASIPGLVGKVSYRPSSRSQMRAQVAFLDARQRNMVAHLIQAPNTPLPPDLSDAQAARVIDVAVLVLKATHGRELLTGTNPEVVRVLAALRERRARIDGPLIAAEPPTPKPIDKAPDLQHGSMRALLGSGITSQYTDAFATLGYRLALHDLVDPPDGEPELSQLQFLDTQVRFDVTRRRMTLDRLVFAEVVALNPLSGFERSLSWRARAFGMRLHDRGCPDCFAHGVDGALGATLATSDERTALFVMADAYVAFSGSLNGIGGSFVRVGLGPFAGARFRLGEETVALLAGTLSYLPTQSPAGTFDLRAAIRTRLDKDVALGIEGAAQPESVEAQLCTYLYF
jgi:hypothetical protein